MYNSGKDVRCKYMRADVCLQLSESLDMALLASDMVNALQHSCHVVRSRL